MAAITFGIVFLAELVDTSALATLALSARFAARWLLLGVCAAMAVHVGVAVAAGSAVALLPRQPLEILVAVVFLVGAVLLVREGREDDDDDEAAIDVDSIKTRWSAVATSFGVTLLSEFADPTQVVTATLAARYSAPIAVGVGSFVALCAVSVLAVYAGSRLWRVVPVRWAMRVAAAVLVVLSVLSVVEAIRD